MRPLTVLLPTDFIAEIDQARERMTGVRSRSAALHLLADLGLRLVKAQTKKAAEQDVTPPSGLPQIG